jgi:hypothetical protein
MLKEALMIGRKLTFLSLGLTAALYVAALISSPAPARACAWFCTGGGLSGCQFAKNSCAGATSCVPHCIPIQPVN